MSRPPELNQVGRGSASIAVEGVSVIIHGSLTSELENTLAILAETNLQIAIGGKALVSIGVPLVKFSDVRGKWVQVPGNGLVFAMSDPPREEEIRVIVREAVRRISER